VVLHERWERGGRGVIMMSIERSVHMAKPAVWSVRIVVLTCFSRVSESQVQIRTLAPGTERRVTADIENTECEKERT
jgi:hypothetical protein